MGLSISIKGRGEPPAANKQICIFTKCRYAYVDIPMGLAIKKALEEGVLDFVVAYDIACKYSVKFWDRVTQHPDGKPLLDPAAKALFNDCERTLKWLIGKFHLGGHQEECSKKYSFNYNVNVGRMSGELVETIWSDFDWLKFITREMGIGVRQEMLSDGMNGWNWQKIILMGASSVCCSAVEVSRSAFVAVEAGRSGSFQPLTPHNPHISLCAIESLWGCHIGGIEGPKAPTWY